MFGIQIGDEIEFDYPRSTHVRFVHKCGYKRRRVRVESIRDLVKTPLTTEEFMRRPFVLRSRFLIRGQDLDRQRVRNFYVGCSREWSAPTELRIATYDEDAWPTAILYRPIQATPSDRQLLLRALQLWRERSELRIYADDLRIVG